MISRDDKNRSILLSFGVLIVAGIIGNLVGKLFGLVLPNGAFRDVLSEGFRYGIEPAVNLDLWMCTLTLGFTLQINLCGFLCMLFFLFLFKKA